jgi:hypothetical protein
MDFDLTYTPAEEEFRREVRAWLAENTPNGVAGLPAGEEAARRQYLQRREMGRRLGGRGWLYPAAPVAYGGGGLDVGAVLVLEEEMRRMDLSLPPYYDSGGWLGSATILAWGTEVQKQRMLPPIFTGEVRTWQLLTEPEAGSDLASVRLAAHRKEDCYVLSGQKIFVGSAHGADRFWMIACTDSSGRRHENPELVHGGRDSAGYHRPSSSGTCRGRRGPQEFRVL